MAADAIAAEEFYATPRGAMVARLLRERLGTLWPSVAGQSVLGLGYAAPYLRLWQEKSAALHRLTPAQVGAARWPAGDQPNLSCAGQEDALPFPDLCFDRILLVHGLEAAENARRLLREVWRVLKDDGQRAGGGAEPARPVGLCGKHAVRPGPALFRRPDRPAARRLAVPGGTPGRRPVTCRRCGTAPSCAAPVCGKTAPAAFCRRASPA